MCKQYLLLWINFDVNYIYLQIPHHVDMLCYYKTLTTNMSSNIFNCCVYWAAADTFVNDFTWTHCASCLFNNAWFIYMLLLIGLTFLTHPPNKRKHISNPVAHRFQEHVVQPGNLSKTLGTGELELAPGVFRLHATIQLESDLKQCILVRNFIQLETPPMACHCDACHKCTARAIWEQFAGFSGQLLQSGYTSSDFDTFLGFFHA